MVLFAAFNLKDLKDPERMNHDDFKFKLYTRRIQMKIIASPGLRADQRRRVQRVGRTVFHR